MIKKQEKSLMARAVAYLARREYSRTELLDKLKAYLIDGQSEQDIERVLDRLQEMGYLSDARYAQIRARVRGEKFGNRRIMNELRAKGVDDEHVQAAIDSLKESEPARALRVWERKFSDPPKDAKEKARQIRYLAYRGFSFEVIMQVMDLAAQGRPYQDE